MYRIVEYTHANGQSPYSKWLEKLDKTTVARIQARIFRFETGNLGDVKLVGDGVVEARIHFGAGYRVYFSQQGQDIILLLCGGDKSSQKKDIKQAKVFLADYLEANRGS